MNLEIKSAVGERVRSGMPRNLHNSEQQVFVFTFAAITFDSGITAAITDLLALAALAPAIYQTLLPDAMRMRWEYSLSRTTPFLFSLFRLGINLRCIVIWICYLTYLLYHPEILVKSHFTFLRIKMTHLISLTVILCSTLHSTVNSVKKFC